MSRLGIPAVALLMGVAMAPSACSHRRDAVATRRSEAGPDTLRSRAESTWKAFTATREPGSLAMVPAARVLGWAGSGNRTFEVATRTSEDAGHARRFGTQTLQTSLRTRPLGQYPCTSCHLGRRVTMTDRRAGDVHHDVQPAHPRQTGARCSTCHASEDVQLLALENGERVTLDQSYRLCADCHYAQVNAWAHGAHGKRLDGWQGRRVVMACPDCHDPHQPGLVKRIPFRAPTVERIREAGQ